MQSPLTMPPQSLNLNEYGSESGVPVLQARNFAFLGHESVKITLFFFGSLCFSFGKKFRGGGGLICIAAPAGSSAGGFAPAPGSASGTRRVPGCKDDAEQLQRSKCTPAVEHLELKMVPTKRSHVPPVHEAYRPGRGQNICVAALSKTVFSVVRQGR